MYILIFMYVYIYTFLYIHIYVYRLSRFRVSGFTLGVSIEGSRDQGFGNPQRNAYRNPSRKSHKRWLIKALHGNIIIGGV